MLTLMRTIKIYLSSLSINLPNLKISFLAIKETVNTHKGIQSPTWRCFAKIFSGSHRLTIARSSIIDKWQGSEYASK